MHIENYRLLNNVTIALDKSATLIVGRNNTGKTSLMDFMLTVINGGKLSFADYPMTCRDRIYDLILKYGKEEITYNEVVKNFPTPSLTFYIDYALDSDDQYLGNLSPFIIDTDVDTTEVIIKAEYWLSASEEAVKALLGNHEIPEADAGNEDVHKSFIKPLVKEYFSELLSLRILAINPTNSDDIMIKTQNEIKALFPIRVIRAERGMDESETQNKNPLSPILNRLFRTDIDEIKDTLQIDISNLRTIVDNANNDVKEKTNCILNNILEKSIRFGYPNAEELQLRADSRIALAEQIESKTDLTYIAENSLEELPSTHNGLGYKNLIKIEFELAEFSKIISESIKIAIPLLFVEEPESHMHPQLQQTFVKFLTQFLDDIAQKSVQVIMTTHSSHIANTVPFDKIRYVRKRKLGVEYKDLSEFCSAFSENADFIRKYLTLSRCDLFFADKAIFIEGTAERILIPDMISKCQTAGFYKSMDPQLPSQYYSLVEVGGAYAYKFFPFIDFLGIPTLVITDIDSTSGPHSKAAFVSEGDSSSNITIKGWFREVNQKDKNYKVTLKEIIELPDDRKTCKRRHIEYQTEENGLSGRSLEESIINVNRVLYGLGEPVTETSIDFGNDKKSDFALDLLLEKAEYTIPSYIKNGLIWLDEQPVVVD